MPSDKDRKHQEAKAEPSKWDFLDYWDISVAEWVELTTWTKEEFEWYFEEIESINEPGNES